VEVHAVVCQPGAGFFDGVAVVIRRETHDEYPKTYISLGIKTNQVHLALALK
jgi:hypothetical protein